MYVLPCGILLIAALCLPAVMPYKTGAPEQACYEMTPNHKGILPQVSQMPYELYFTTESVNGINITRLTLTTLVEPFKGFLVKAVDFVNVKRVLGKFDVSNSGGLAKTLNCFGGEANAVTHVNADRKEKVTVEWTAPQDFSGKVQFLYTVVKELQTFWVNGKSKTLEVTAADDTTTTTLATTQHPIITTPKAGGSCALRVSVLWLVMTLVIAITSTEVPLRL